MRRGIFCGLCEKVRRIVWKRCACRDQGLVTKLISLPLMTKTRFTKPPLPLPTLLSLSLSWYSCHQSCYPCDTLWHLGVTQTCSTLKPLLIFQPWASVQTNLSSHHPFPPPPSDAMHYMRKTIIAPQLYNECVFSQVCRRFHGPKM